MKAHHILGAVLAVITVGVLVLDITAPAVFAIVAIVWAAFAVSVALVERQECRDREQVARMAERQQQLDQCEAGPTEPEWYREGVRW